MSLPITQLKAALNGRASSEPPFYIPVGDHQRFMPAECDDYIKKTPAETTKSAKCPSEDRLDSGTLFIFLSDVR